MKFSSNIVQLSEEKPAWRFLLLGKLLQFKLNFKSVKSFHQANNWRPAAADSCLGGSVCRGTGPLCMCVAAASAFCFDFTWPLSSDPQAAVPLAASWSCCDTFPQQQAFVTPHQSFPNISFCIHCPALVPATTFSPLDGISVKISRLLSLPMPTLHLGSPTKEAADLEAVAPISVYYPRPPQEAGSLLLSSLTVSLALGTPSTFHRYLWCSGGFSTCTCTCWGDMKTGCSVSRPLSRIWTCRELTGPNWRVFPYFNPSYTDLRTHSILPRRGQFSLVSIITKKPSSKCF